MIIIMIQKKTRTFQKLIKEVTKYDNYNDTEKTRTFQKLIKEVTEYDITTVMI